MSRLASKIFNTKLTRLLGIRTPVVSPPMAGAAGGELAGQVSLAGGFGFLSAGYGASADDFKHQLSLARSAVKLQTPPSTAQFPVGVGYLAWQLEQPNSSLVDLLSVALDHNVQAVWFAFGEDLGRWIQFVRDHDTRMGKEQKTTIFVQISTVKEALVAVNEWKVDCIVAQGVESGGHGAGYALPVLNLVPSILSAMPAEGPPILAAGGLANGDHIAAMLTMGAAGAVLGTRFLLAYESLYSDVQRKALVGANSDMSVRSMAWDHARETLGWPAGVDGRGLRNSKYTSIVEYSELERNEQTKFKEGVKNQDPDRIIVWAGTGVGQMNQTQTAKSIVEELHEECLESLMRASQLYH